MILLDCAVSFFFVNKHSVQAGIGYISKVVDMYNSATGTWSTAQLSVGRSHLAATSVGNVALFAGGYTGGTCLLIRRCCVGRTNFVVEFCTLLLRLLHVLSDFGNACHFQMTHINTEVPIQRLLTFSTLPLALGTQTF